MRNISHKICRQNKNTHFTFNNFLYRKSCRLWDNVEKFCTAGQATHENKAQAHCMLDYYGYKRTFRVYNTSTYSVCTATMVMRTRLLVKLYVHCLSH